MSDYSHAASVGKTRFNYLIQCGHETSHALTDAIEFALETALAESRRECEKLRESGKLLVKRNTEHFDAARQATHDLTEALRLDVSDLVEKGWIVEVSPGINAGAGKVAVCVNRALGAGPIHGGQLYDTLTEALEAVRAEVERGEGEK